MSVSEFCRLYMVILSAKHLKSSLQWIPCYWPCLCRYSNYLNSLGGETGLGPSGAVDFNIKFMAQLVVLFLFQGVHLNGLEFIMCTPGT